MKQRELVQWTGRKRFCSQWTTSPGVRPGRHCGYGSVASLWLNRGHWTCEVLVMYAVRSNLV